MTFQNLQDCSRLEVPDIDFIIFTPADNMFPFDGGKARRDAEGSVDMARVRFDTSRVLVIP